MPEALAYNLNFLHPLLMLGLLALSSYGMLLGIKAKKTRTADAETRKQLIKGQFAKRHFQIGSLILAITVLGTFGGMAVTYLNNGKLFVGPHLLVPQHGNDDPVSVAGGEWLSDPQQNLGKPPGLSAGFGSRSQVRKTAQLI